MTPVGGRFDKLGVTSVREVVQAKRHKRTIQRKDLVPAIDLEALTDV